MSGSHTSPTFPQQKRYSFTLANASRTFRRAFPATGVDGAIHAGLERLVSTYMAREWGAATD